MMVVILHLVMATTFESDIEYCRFTVRGLEQQTIIHKICFVVFT